MNRLPQAARRTILFAGCAICLLSIVAVSVNLRTHSQQPNVPSQANKDSLLKFVESSPELPLKIAGNNDCPFRILQATVKKVSGSEFSRLTGRTTNQATVSTVPEVKLVNTSQQTITSFLLVVRDPQSRTSRGFVQQKVSIGPGETYLVKRDHFVNPERQTIAATNQPARQTVAQPGLASDKYWLQFDGALDEVFVTVGKVTFSDGATWLIQEGGDVK